MTRLIYTSIHRSEKEPSRSFYFSGFFIFYEIKERKDLWRRYMASSNVSIIIQTHLVDYVTWGCHEVMTSSSWLYIDFANIEFEGSYSVVAPQNFRWWHVDSYNWSIYNSYVGGIVNLLIESFVWGRDEKLRNTLSNHNKQVLVSGSIKYLRELPFRRQNRTKFGFGLSELIEDLRERLPN